MDKDVPAMLQTLPDVIFFFSWNVSVVLACYLLYLELSKK